MNCLGHVRRNFGNIMMGNFFQKNGNSSINLGKIFEYEPLTHLESRRLWRGITIHNFAAHFARCAFSTPKDNGVDASIDIFLVASPEYHLIQNSTQVSCKKFQ